MNARKAKKIRKLASQLIERDPQAYPTIVPRRGAYGQSLGQAINGWRTAKRQARALVEGGLA